MNNKMEKLIDGLIIFGIIFLKSIAPSLVGWVLLFKQPIDYAFITSLFWGIGVVFSAYNTNKMPHEILRNIFYFCFYLFCIISIVTGIIFSQEKWYLIPLLSTMSFFTGSLNKNYDLNIPNKDKNYFD